MVAAIAGGNQTKPVRVMRPADRRSLSRSATRALDVLECFGQQQRRLRAIEIARMLDLRSSTANQLLKTMTESAHLVFDSNTKTYFPSLRLTGFSNFLSGIFGGNDKLLRLVSDLHSGTQLSVSLTTPNGLFMQIVHIETAPGVETQRGLQVSIFGSVIGSAYVSSLSEAAIRVLAAKAGTDLPAILRVADEAKKSGFSHGHGPDERICTVAMPLPEYVAPMSLVLAVGGHNREVEGRIQEIGMTMKNAFDHWFSQ